MISSVIAHSVLSRAAAAWFITAMVGQWAFLYYIVGFYGASTLGGDFADWQRNILVRTGYVPNDTIGNLVFASHVLVAALIAFGGVLQLIPQLRSRWPAWHRWNGRVFLLTAFAAALGGLYLVWLRGDGPVNVWSAVAISSNAVLLLASGALAWRAARCGDSQAHRRWALRAFILANGVWFFRVGLFAWLILNQGPAGMTAALDGPFDRFWAFASYLLPLAVLELYLRAKDSNRQFARLAMGGGLAALTVIMGIGIVGVSGFLFRLV